MFAPTPLDRFASHPRPLRLLPVIQPYAWGGHTVLAQLTGVEPSPDLPRAELWIGDHPGGPARALVEGTAVPLDALVAAAPRAVLGDASLARFGARLPYLLKVLDVRAMLSIQAHPTKAQAEEGFAREEAAGIPRSAPHRNYRDRNHKPEAQVALTDFWLLCGFRPLADIRALLAQRPGLDALVPMAAPVAGVHEAASLRALYEHVMGLPQEAIDRLLGPWLAALAASSRDDASSRADAPTPDSPDYWAARAAREFALPGGHHDRGIVSIYLLNLVRLSPGEGAFLPAGVLHAYLSGVAVEVMASSDNVLRGGLTLKHVDVPELLRIVRFEPGAPVVTGGEPLSDIERTYAAPVDEFALARLTLPPGGAVTRLPFTPDALIVIEGGMTLEGAGERLVLTRGQVALVPSGVGYTLRSDEGAIVFRAS